MIHRKLTGKLRYRTHSRWWATTPIVVLQVQVHAKGYRTEQHGSEEVDEIFWQDATIGDITNFRMSLIGES